MSMISYLVNLLGLRRNSAPTDGVESRVFLADFPSNWTVKLVGCVYPIRGTALENVCATLWHVTDQYGKYNLFMKTTPVCTMIMRIGDERRLVDNPHQIFGEDTVTFYGDRRIQSKIEVFNNIAIARQAALAASAKQDQ